MRLSCASRELARFNRFAEVGDGGVSSSCDAAGTAPKSSENCEGEDDDVVGELLREELLGVRCDGDTSAGGNDRRAATDGLLNPPYRAGLASVTYRRGSGVCAGKYER